MSPGTDLLLRRRKSAKSNHKWSSVPEGEGVGSEGAPNPSCRADGNRKKRGSAAHSPRVGRQKIDRSVDKMENAMCWEAVEKGGYHEGQGQYPTRSTACNVGVAD